jgi:hypothetical protein
MAEEKAPAAKVGKTDAPISARLRGYSERDGVQYPSLLIQGEAPRKGSTLSVRLENGLTYSARVHGSSEADGGHLVETEGLEVVRDEPAAAPPSDIVNG